MVLFLIFVLVVFWLCLCLGIQGVLMSLCVWVFWFYLFWFRFWFFDLV